MKKIILCPNPNRDRGMETTRRADAILRQMGFQTVVCPPFKDQKDGAYGDYKTRPLTAELKTALDTMPASYTAEQQLHYCHDEIFARMQRVREIIDHMETLVAADFWPVPTYYDLLFSV